MQVAAFRASNLETDVLAFRSIDRTQAPPVDPLQLTDPIQLAWALRARSTMELAATVDGRVDSMPRARSEELSRVLNVFVAGLALLLMLPVMLLIALAIRLGSRGPVFYSQMRVGLDRRVHRDATDERRVHDMGGKPFTMYKFRTMCLDAEPDGKAVWAQRRDPRVTPVGRVLRRTRLDELPQLWNVLRGDMNIVGPRPERPCIFAELRESIPGYPLRQRVKPGITGWAQITQAYDCCLDDVRNKVQKDIEYLSRQSVTEDLRIMSLTIPVMLFRRGGW